MTNQANFQLAIQEAISSSKQAVDQLIRSLSILNMARPRDLLDLPNLQHCMKEEKSEGLRITYDDLHKALECAIEIRDVLLKQELYKLD
jgi:hypothetical protein